MAVLRGAMHMVRRTAIDEPQIVTEAIDDPWPAWEPLLDWTAHIHQDPDILVGKPVVRGTRLSAEFLIELFAAGWTEEAILEEYDQVSKEALRAVLAFAAQCIRERYPVTSPDGTS
jgi:uncharacterized protein (DUF433 family)